MSIRWTPEPKLARTSGAYTVARRGPNWLRRAGVATITSTPSGSGADGCTTDSLLAETLAASSAWHISGSQPMSTLGRTCCAIQAAAWSRSAAAICSALGVLGASSVGWADEAFCACSPWWVKASVTSAPRPIAATALSTRTPRWRRRRFWWLCRCRHRRTVVTATVAQDGFPLVPGVRLCCCSPISTPTTPLPRGVGYQAVRSCVFWRFHPYNHLLLAMSRTSQYQHARPRYAFPPDKSIRA